MKLCPRYHNHFHSNALRKITASPWVSQTLQASALKCIFYPKRRLYWPLKNIAKSLKNFNQI